eukprot:TRINITY_DN23425_c0_g2_i2.p1 TRINITY_DN23425_c0_g2~~TRINITY_DN23425_c0_g2_i2.p1  ORF type:complete len:153 (+),score=33.56 TRINITY_DN23425_c0_g2_i2:201-659(+)
MRGCRTALQHRLCTEYKASSIEEVGTALVELAKAGKHDEILRLAAAGVRLDTPDATGCTALLWACTAGSQVELGGVLVGGGADVNASNMHGETVLMRAAKRGHASTVMFLVRAGAIIGLRDHDDRTALDYACNHNRVDVAKMLIQLERLYNS